MENQTDHPHEDIIEKFNSLYKSYEKQLKNKAFAILKDKGWAEDAVQSAFEKIARHLDKIINPSSVEARCYMYTILVNECYILYKKNKRYELMDAIAIQESYSRSGIDEDETMEKILCKELLEDVNAIPEIYANLLILNALYEYSCNEIAEMLDMNPATVRKRVQRGREMLRGKC